MLQVELLQYKIVRLDMVDMIKEGGDVRLLNSTECEGQFEDEEDLAMVNLTEYVEMDGGHDKFHIELELEGFFHIEGMKTREIRKEAHAMCYDKLRTYAVQIIKHLAAETGMMGVVPPQRHMEPELIEFGGKPEERKEKAMKFQMKKWWIVNTFLDNFFKVVFPVLYRGLIAQRGMYPVMVIPVHIIP